MDVLMWHYDKSVFKYWNRNFWNPNYSWQAQRLMPAFFGIVRLDGWHIVKYGMLISIASAIYCGGSNVILLMLAWSIGFEITYKLLRK
jgi:hypothetical protein